MMDINEQILVALNAIANELAIANTLKAAELRGELHASQRETDEMLNGEFY